MILFIEIHQFFGSDATIAGIRFQFSTTFKGYANQLKVARESGIDCKNVVLGASKGNGWIALYSSLLC